MALCPSVRLSITSRCSIETDERIELVFGVGASFHLCYKEIHVPSKIRYRPTSVCNFAPNSGLRKFRHGISIIDACYQLSSRKADARSVINGTVVGQLS